MVSHRNISENVARDTVANSALVSSAPQPQPLPTEDIAPLLESVVAENHALRPANTKKAYQPHINTYQAWCGTKFPGETVPHVTSERLALFITEKVIGREKRGRPGQVVGIATVKMAISAIMYLHQCHLAAGQDSPMAQPRRGLVKLILTNVHRQTSTRLRENFEDRGAVPLVEGYTTFDELAAIVSSWWNKNSRWDQDMYPRLPSVPLCYGSWGDLP